jgi:uncharacterized protein YjbI with pentapeptide repeats
LTDANAVCFIAENVKMVRTDFSRATLTKSNFINADLSGARFVGATLTNATFKNVDLTNVDFMGATTDGTKFENVTICGNVHHGIYSFDEYINL